MIKLSYMFELNNEIEFKDIIQCSTCHQCFDTVELYKSTECALNDFEVHYVD